ncbi:MAG: glycosyltransferase [Verrucomicrobiota bacterium]|jgi:glycosyltransferase involved in cell wall biosynthesis|nr:glycosyltransferase [Verrucomicrobiota bacterium]
MTAGWKVALSHDWLNGMRGGERCLEWICKAYPQADLYTLLYRPEMVTAPIRERAVHASFLQRLPGFRNHYRWFLPFFPAAIEAFRLPPETNLVLSTSHCVAKGIIPPKGAKHLCYCFTPMRYAWSMQEDYFGRNPVKLAVLNMELSRLRRWDRAASSRVDHFVAISRYIQDRIRACYGRESTVVYPPVATDYFTPAAGGGHDGFDLIVSALVPYKRVDLAVQAYTQSGYPLKISGVGTELETLRRQAGPNVEFLGRVPDEGVRSLYRRCRFLVFPGEEDFGIVPLEAQACGKPVLAYGAGGALETVVDGVTGVYFNTRTPGALLSAVEHAAAQSWDAVAIRRHAEQFSAQRFVDGLQAEINRLMGA